uniref:Uncharacterized protein n=1 Tax=Arundo donax TaxID=35708 RepID=A0A0A9F5K1_ARUDO
MCLSRPCWAHCNQKAALSFQEIIHKGVHHSSKYITLGGVRREDGGETVEDFGAAALGVDELGLRDGERDGVESGGDEADSPSGLLGLPAWVLVGNHWAVDDLATVPLPLREGTDTEEHLEALLLR